MGADGSNLLFCVPCLFGLEGLCADELRRLGYDNVEVENGRVLFSGGVRDIANANINLRTGERVLLTVGEVNACSFDELFEGVRGMPWEEYIPANGAFPVKGYTRGSKLFGESACQSIIKKAVVTRLQEAHKRSDLPESGALYQIQFAIVDDIAALYLDTSGAGLHKRGYRPVSNEAPLGETLAAAIVKLSRYKGREQVCDPFCGSGTIPIEAALAAINRAPGLMRTFSAQGWAWADAGIWDDVREEARSREYKGKYEIWGGDTDPGCIDIARANAGRAGVAEYIRFEVADALSFRREDFSQKSEGLIIMTNPPYGERVMEPSEAQELYRGFGAAVSGGGAGVSGGGFVSGSGAVSGGAAADKIKMYILSSHTEFERAFGMKAVKKRKLYNGMIKCNLFMYY